MYPWIRPPKFPVLSHRNHQTSNISRNLVGNNIVDLSDVVGASPVCAAPTASSFSTKHIDSMDWAGTVARPGQTHLSFGIWRVLPVIVGTGFFPKWGPNIRQLVFCLFACFCSVFVCFFRTWIRFHPWGPWSRKRFLNDILHVSLCMGLSAASLDSRHKKYIVTPFAQICPFYIPNRQHIMTRGTWKHV